MDAREYWNTYIENVGGIAAAAEKLGTPYSTVAGICNGSRGIGHKLAQRFAERDRMLDASRLVWVRPIKPDPEQPPARRRPVARGDAAGNDDSNLDEAA